MNGQSKGVGAEPSFCRLADFAEEMLVYLSGLSKDLCLFHALIPRWHLACCIEGVCGPGDMQDVVPFRRIVRPKRNYLLWSASSGVVTRFQSNHIRVAQLGCSNIRFFRATFSLARSCQRIDQLYLFSVCAGQACAIEHAMQAVHKSARGTCNQIGPNHD